MQAKDMIDYFKPKTIQDHSQITIELQTRIHVFMVLMLIMTILSGGYTLLLTMLHLFTDDHFISGITTGLLGTLGGAGVLLYFKRSGKFWAACMLLSTIFLVACLGSIAISGGLRSPLLPMLTACPIVAAVTGGRHEGIYYTLITLLAVLMLVGVNSMGIEWLHITAESNSNVFHATTWIITLTVNIGCLFSYQHFHEQLLHHANLATLSPRPTR